MSASPYRMFEVVGVEAEYMIVDAETLSVLPIADRVLAAVGGSGEVEVDLGPVAWSNELALHVVEIKTNGPVADLEGLDALFHDSIERIDEILAGHGARLMPTAMHPWMDPHAELRLWPHEAGPIYRAYDRIFDCRGHGWANLQSLHINLPFADDEEFGRLHAAIRYLLPILPALAASSPVVDGAYTGLLDNRMEFYRRNSRRVPAVAGAVVPERVWTREQYEREILGRIYDDLAPHDPEGTLRFEWANSRGCIARFDRGAIEIRVLDVQESPRADLAVVAVVVAVLRAMVQGTLGDPEAHRRWHESDLAAIFLATIRDAEAAPVADSSYATDLGIALDGEVSAGALWGRLIDVVAAADPWVAPHAEVLGVLRDHGSLARRIVAGAGASPQRESLHRVYGRLCDCLHTDTLYVP